MAKRQGADFTLKADTPDLQAALEASIGEKFDMSFECCGVPAALNNCIEVTIPGGVVCVVANMPKTVHVDLQVACRHEVHLLKLFGAVSFVSVLYLSPERPKEVIILRSFQDLFFCGSFKLEGLSLSPFRWTSLAYIGIATSIHGHWPWWRAGRSI